MVPEVFNGTTVAEAPSEPQLCAALGAAECAARLTRHRDAFITAADFTAIRARGFDTVRIPFATWHLAPEPPLPAGGVDYLDRAVHWARAANLTVVFCLHGAAQSGDGPSGYVDPDWTAETWRRSSARALQTLSDLAARYAGSKDVHIELLNEPDRQIPFPEQRDFYVRAVAAIRKSLPNATVVVPLYPIFWTYLLSAADFAALGPNVAVDLHLYPLFGANWDGMSLAALLRVASRWGEIVNSAAQIAPVIVGEWSLQQPLFNGMTVSRSESDQIGQEWFDAYLAQLACTELHALQPAAGTFFWSWKVGRTLEEPGWSVEQATRRGWLGNLSATEPCSTDHAVGSRFDTLDWIEAAVLVVACVPATLLPLQRTARLVEAIALLFLLPFLGLWRRVLLSFAWGLYLLPSVSDGAIRLAHWAALIAAWSGASVWLVTRVSGITSVAAFLFGIAVDLRALCVRKRCRVAAALSGAGGAALFAVLVAASFAVPENPALLYRLCASILGLS
jgi:glucan 1,3-beta-glucosidase